MIIDSKLLDALSEEAKASPRLRFGKDMRTTPEDQSQRLLNALEPGTILPIHRHKKTSETLIVLRGSVEQRMYNDDGKVIFLAKLSANTDRMGISIPKGQWHDLISLESGTVIFETKDGSYFPLTDDDIIRQ